MITNSNRAAPSRLRVVFCLLFAISAGLVVLAGIASSRAIDQGGSASPEDDGKRIAGGADISPERFREPMSQRVEDDAFHLKIAPWVIEHTANGQRAEFIVVLTDQADLSGAAALTTKMEKGRYVYHALRNKSWATQTPILQWLRDRGIEHQSFYIVNAILVRGSREVAEALASRQDVARIEGNLQIKNILPQRIQSLMGRRQSSDRRRLSPA